MAGFERSIPLVDAIRVFNQEYLASYVRSGGGTVKVLVTEQASKGDLFQGFKDAALQANFLWADADSSICRVHHAHELYKTVARQLPWYEAVNRFLQLEFASEGINIPAAGLADLRTLEKLNGVRGHELVKLFQRIVARSLITDYNLYRDFRLAIASLCKAALESTEDARLTQVRVLDWLIGDLRYIGALRGSLVFQKINKYNARNVLTSTSRWLRKCGYSGLVVGVDVARYTSWRRWTDGSLNYTRATALDSWELIRQFIDATDELVSLAVLFIASPEFLYDEQRGLNAYEALRLRLTDEVHDRSRANPFASMLRIS